MCFFTQFDDGGIGAVVVVGGPGPTTDVEVSEDGLRTVGLRTFRQYGTFQRTRYTGRFRYTSS